jgi:hypothetical protein
LFCPHQFVVCCHCRPRQPLAADRFENSRRCDSSIDLLVVVSL